MYVLLWMSLIFLSFCIASACFGFNLLCNIMWFLSSIGIFVCSRFKFGLDWPQNEQLIQAFSVLVLFACIMLHQLPFIKLCLTLLLTALLILHIIFPVAQSKSWSILFKFIIYQYGFSKVIGYWKIDSQFCVVLVIQVLVGQQANSGSARFSLGRNNYDGAESRRKLDVDGWHILRRIFM